MIVRYNGGGGEAGALLPCTPDKFTSLQPEHVAIAMNEFISRKL